MKKTRVLVADDSVVYRSQIKAALLDLPFVEVIGVAANGQLALEMMQQKPVDLVILDLEMPVMDGLQTLKEMKTLKITCKSLVFSSSSKRGAEITFDALKAGASDFIAKPGPAELQGGEPHLKIRALLEPKISALFPQKSENQTHSLTFQNETQKYPSVIWDLFKPDIVVIGSSTGGPTMLERIFAELKGPLSCPVLITQHMPPVFTASLAERLQKISGIPAREGKNGEVLQNNTIYMAPGDFHMRVVGTKARATIMLDQGPLMNSVRPAVDPLFESVASIYKEKSLGLVLTGMGADGRAGAQSIKSMGGSVLIQNESSCVVFGMPGAVMASGAFDRALSPAEIVNALQDKIGIYVSPMTKTVSSGGQ